MLIYSEYSKEELLARKKIVIEDMYQITSKAVSVNTGGFTYRELNRWYNVLIEMQACIDAALLRFEEIEKL